MFCTHRYAWHNSLALGKSNAPGRPWRAAEEFQLISWGWGEREPTRQNPISIYVSLCKLRWPIVANCWMLVCISVAQLETWLSTQLRYTLGALTITHIVLFKPYTITNKLWRVTHLSMLVHKQFIRGHNLGISKHKVVLRRCSTVLPSGLLSRTIHQTSQTRCLMFV